MNRRLRIFRIAMAGTAALLIAGASSDVFAQELEPRAYSPSPLGVNFLGLGYLRSAGGVAVDPSLPLDNVDAEVNAASLSYVRTFGLFGRSASIGFVLPYSRADVSGDVFEQQRSVTRTGWADPRLRLAVNLFGGPALDREEFAAREPSTAVGASLMVVAPLGKYDSDRLINLGSNRWAIKSEIGVYQPLGPWSLELYGGVWFYTDNDDFFGGVRREQEPIATLQAHVGYTFRPGLWLAADATYYAGGQSTINGVRKEDRQENTRFGLTLSLPVAQGHSLKLNWSEGVTERIGTSFTTFGVTWQYTWFD
jgi:Putative MetA-pathway of phenol degradation